MIHKYDDIINYPHHTSPTRPRMPRIDRAAQFAPFAALAGYNTAIQETGRVTEPRIELTEDCKAALDLKQRMLLESGGEHPEIRVTYFLPDPRKDGGRYITAEGRIKSILQVPRILLFTDGRRIPLDDIVDIESPEDGKFMG